MPVNVVDRRARLGRLPPASCFFESSKACRNCANVNDDGGFAGIVSFLCVSCQRQPEAGAVGCANKGLLPHYGACCTPRLAGHATRGRRCGSRESAAHGADRCAHRAADAASASNRGVPRQRAGRAALKGADALTGTPVRFPSRAGTRGLPSFSLRLTRSF